MIQPFPPFASMPSVVHHDLFMHRFGTHRVAALRVSPPLLLRARIGTQHDIALPLVQAREILQSEQFRQMMFVPFHVGFSFHSKSLSRLNRLEPGILRSMVHMASMMRSAGLEPLASPFEGSTPVVPGNSSAPPASNTTCRRPGSWWNPSSSEAVRCGSKRVATASWRCTTLYVRTSS